MVPALSMRALRTGGPVVVHLAPLRSVPYPESVGGGTFLYPARRAKCGVETWGAAGKVSEATCKRCLR